MASVQQQEGNKEEKWSIKSGEIILNEINRNEATLNVFFSVFIHLLDFYECINSDFCPLHLDFWRRRGWKHYGEVILRPGTESSCVAFLKSLFSSVFFSFFNLHHPHDAMWYKLICFSSLPPNLAVGNLPCFTFTFIFTRDHLHLLADEQQQQRRRRQSRSPQKRHLHFLSVFKVIFITQTRPPSPQKNKNQYSIRAVWTPPVQRRWVCRISTTSIFMNSLQKRTKHTGYVSVVNIDHRRRDSIWSRVVLIHLHLKMRSCDVTARLRFSFLRLKNVCLLHHGRTRMCRHFFAFVCLLLYFSFHASLHYLLCVWSEIPSS